VNIFGVKPYNLQLIKLLFAVKVTVVYFAQARENAGVSEDEFIMGSPVSMEELFVEAMKAHPRLQEIKDRLSILVNGRYATSKAELNDGDRVALVPPVGGG